MSNRFLFPVALLALASSCTSDLDHTESCSPAFVTDLNAMVATLHDSSTSSRQDLNNAKARAQAFKQAYSEEVCVFRQNGTQTFIDAGFEAEKIVRSSNSFLAALDARETNPSASGPIVASSNQGGQITGLVEDSVTGLGLEGAQVGIREERSLGAYIYETTTNADGRYESPFLLPGEYIVDITHPNYLVTGASAIRVEIGGVTEANISASQPIGNSPYRFTVSWCDNCEGGVQDVDSYLRTPNGTHVFWANPQPAGVGVDLDRDEREWSGPETVTINDLSATGEYVYYVDNYSERGDAQALGNSAIRILVYTDDSAEAIDETIVPAGVGLRYEAYRITNGQLRRTGRFIPEGNGTDAF